MSSRELPDRLRLESQRIILAEGITDLAKLLMRAAVVIEMLLDGEDPDEPIDLITDSQT